MGAYWLFGSARRDRVLPASQVDTWPGWETRSRGSGGYDQVWAVFVHHTASTRRRCNGLLVHVGHHVRRSADRGDLPRRYGVVIVGAAGATNCQGSGGGHVVTSIGTIPLDCGNAYGIAIEAANNGTGEPWPSAQTDAYVKLVRGAVRRLRPRPGHRRS